jgi:beta-phosphoglucomutase-like phosphatase (HAD superfamily)
MGTILPDDWLENVYRELYFKPDREVRIISGVDEVLDARDFAGISYAVGSNGRVKKMEVMLRRVGLWPRLKRHLYSAQALKAPKPAPDVYLKATADFGEALSDCVVVEDSITGAKAARAAGIRCFGYTANTNLESLAPFTDAFFSCYSQGLICIAPVRMKQPIVDFAMRWLRQVPTMRYLPRSVAR